MLKHEAIIAESKYVTVEGFAHVVLGDFKKVGDGWKLVGGGHCLSCTKLYAKATGKSPKTFAPKILENGCMIATIDGMEKTFFPKEFTARDIVRVMNKAGKKVLKKAKSFKGKKYTDHFVVEGIPITCAVDMKTKKVITCFPRKQ